MANILGEISVDEVDILEVDSDPSSGAGTAANCPGSLAIVKDVGGGIYELWQKTGTANTAWTKVGSDTHPDPHYLSDGTQSLPAYSFSSDQDTGMWLDSGAIAFTLDGSDKISIDGSQIDAKVPYRGNAGSAAIPQYSFSADSDTGMYRSGINAIGWSINGTQKAYLDGNGFNFKSQARGMAGSATTPSFGFEFNPNTGMYNPSSNALGFTTNGIERINITSAGIVDVKNQIKIQGGTPGAGKVLTSDATGLATWENSSFADDLPAAQGRCTVPYSFTASFVDQDFDITDVETDPSIIEHDNVNIDRLIVKEDGLYVVNYALTANLDAGGDYNYRVTKNDVQSAIPGSMGFQNDSGDSFAISRTFLVELTANDFISFQAQSPTASGTIETGLTVNIVKLRGSKGSTGDTGDTGAGANIIVQKNDATIGTITDILNFEGAGLGTFVDDGGNKTTLNINSDILYTPNGVSAITTENTTKKVTLEGYGGGTIVGTPAFGIAVDVNGNIIERNLPTPDVSVVNISGVTFTSGTFATIPGLSTTVTLGETGNVDGIFTYSAVRSTGTNSTANFRVVVNGSNGTSYTDTLSSFNDTGMCSHFQNLGAGTYTVLVQLSVTAGILINAGLLKATAVES